MEYDWGQNQRVQNRKRLEPPFPKGISIAFRLVLSVETSEGRYREICAVTTASKYAWKLWTTVGFKFQNHSVGGLNQVQTPEAEYKPRHLRIQSARIEGATTLVRT